MTLRSRLCSALASAILASAAGPARAHEYWLSPSSLRAGPGDTVTVGALAGEGFTGERKAFAAARAVRLVARAARVLDLLPVASEGDTAWARFAPADTGGLMLGYESGFATITLEAADFENYLAAEGLDGPLAARRARGDTGPGRERYRRCAKTWLAGGDARRATESLGLPIEIVPLAAPGAAARLRVRVLFEGRPLAGARLHAWRQPFTADGSRLDPAKRDPVPIAAGARTDADGEIEVHVGRPGEWLLGVVHMIPSRDITAADWESHWASLVFTRGHDAR